MHVIYTPDARVKRCLIIFLRLLSSTTERANNDFRFLIINDNFDNYLEQIQYVGYMTMQFIIRIKKMKGLH